MNDGTVVIDTLLDNQGVLKGVSEMDSTVKKGMKSINAAFTAIKSAAVIGALGKMVDAASDLAESQNVVDVTFGKSADTINSWAKAAAYSYGMAEVDAKKYNGTIGAMLKSMGIADDQLVDMSTSIVGLAGDFASFYNLDHQDAFDKIRSGISGETEPLKQLGINMSVANLEAYALSQGIKKSYDSMTQAEQATLRYNYLLSVSADAQGDFTRTSDSFANQLRVAKLELQNMATAIGQALIPAVTNGLQGINKFVNGLKESGALDRFTAAAKTLANVVGKVLGVAFKTVATVANTVLNNFSKLLPVLVAAAGAWAALKVIDTVRGMMYGAGQSILGLVLNLGLETAATGSATAATLAYTAAKTALSSALTALSSPLGLAMVAVGALTAIVVKAATTTTEESQRLKENKAQLEENAKAREQLAQTQQEQIESGLSEIANAERLYTELRNLADANGNISANEVARAKAIAEQLNPVLGETIKLNKDNTATLLDTSNAYKETIKQKRAKIILDGQEAAYNAAVQESQENLNKALENSAAAHEHYRAAQELNKQIEDARKQGLEGLATQLAGQAAAEMEYYAQSTSQAAQYEAAYKTNLDAITAYETDFQAFQDGNYQAILDRNNGLVTSYQGTTDQIIASYDTQLQKTADGMAAMSAEVANGQRDISDTMYKEAQTQLNTVSSGLLNQLIATKQKGEELSVESKSTAQKMIDAYKDLPEEQRTTALRAMVGMIDGITDKVPALKNAASMTGDQIITALEGYLNSGNTKPMGKDAAEGAKIGMEGVDTKGTATTIGVNMATGLQSGINSKATTIAGAAASLVTKALEAARRAGAIHSPSKKFAEIGRYLDQGLALGIEDEANTVENSMQGTIQGLVSKMQATVDAEVSARSLTPALAAAMKQAGTTHTVNQSLTSNDNITMLVDGEVLTRTVNKRNKTNRLIYGTEGTP